MYAIRSYYDFTLNGDFDVIIHGCNCYCTMGAGIAKAIRKEFPEAYEEDCKTKKGDQKKLGNYSAAKVIRNGRVIIIINGYTQYDYKGRGIKVDYDAIRSVFRKVQNDYSGKKIGYPKIGRITSYNVCYTKLLRRRHIRKIQPHLTAGHPANMPAP